MISREKRLPEIDILRGIAIIMMAVFHFAWDLDYFGVISKSSNAAFWEIFQTLTGGLFIFLVGVSLTLSYSRIIRSSPGRYPSKYLLRGAGIFGCGLIITAGSLFFMREAFVFFGILHFIGISIIIATPFIRFRWLNLFLGIATLWAGNCLQQFTFSFPWLVWLWHNYPVNTLDLYTVLPWIGIVLFGLFVGNIIYPKGKRRFRLELSRKTLKSIQFLGRNSLLMYFLHLPVVFVAAWIISLL